MGWAVGESKNSGERRHIGYGVPAWCDHPHCDAKIDRGISYGCGGGVTGDHGCGLFFCAKHLPYMISDDEYVAGELEHARDVDNDTSEINAYCVRCAKYEKPFTPKPDHPEWITHVLTDDSWDVWRAAEPEWVRRLKEMQ